MGQMTMVQRDESISAFQNDDSIQVLLVSLKAGGVGLNLVCASQCYLCDLWWNPAVEEQAVNRIHRIGQTRPVTVKRLIIRSTVEESILRLQEKKLAAAASALNAVNKNDAKQQRLSDLKLLFEARS